MRHPQPQVPGRTPLAIVLLILGACSAGTDGPAAPETPAAVATVTVNPSTASVQVGQTQQLAAVTTDASGNALTGRVVSWGSNSTPIATVTGSGLVTGMAAGTAMITATSENRSGTATITVVPVPVAAVLVSPSTATVEVGATRQLTATTTDAGGTALSGRAVAWASDRTDVATVSEAGLVTAAGAGSATITATSEGKSGTAAITVPAAVVSNFVVYKRGVTEPQAATLTFSSAEASSGTLRIDGYTMTGVSLAQNDAGMICFSGGSGAPLTSCAAGVTLPNTMRVCGPHPSTGEPNTLLYVVFGTPDEQRVSATATALLNALQAETGYLGIGVYRGCGSSFSESWIRNYPQTNYYLWPDVVTTYSPAHVSGLLDGAVIFSTPNAGTDYSQYVAVRNSGGVFEVWH